MKGWPQGVCEKSSQRLISRARSVDERSSWGLRRSVARPVRLRVQLIRHRIARSWTADGASTDDCPGHALRGGSAAVTAGWAGGAPASARAEAATLAISTQS